MRDDEKLNRIEDILPQDIRSSSQRCQRVEIGVCHPDAEGGVFLSESLSGGDRRDTRHSFRCRCRVDENVLVVGAFRGSREIKTDEFAEPELKETSKERGNNEDDDVRDLGVEIEDGCLRHNGGQDDDRSDPEIEGDDRYFHGQDEFFFGLPFIGKAEEPSGEEGS